MTDYVCIDCGHEYEELGNGRCDLCGGEVLPIEAIGEEKEPEEYPEELMEGEKEGLPGIEDEETWPEELPERKEPEEV